MFMHPYEYEMLAGEVERLVAEDEAALRLQAAHDAALARAAPRAAPSFWRLIFRRAGPHARRTD